MLSLAVLFLYCLVFVQAAPLVKRIVVDPPITNPDASTVWTVGQQVTVTWDTSSIPEPKNFTGSLVLGFQTTDSENLDLDNPLVTNISLIAGQTSIVVPNVPPKSTYIVVLFGDSGNASPQFTITGGAASSTASASATAASPTSESDSAPSSAPPSDPTSSSDPAPSTDVDSPATTNPGGPLLTTAASATASSTSASSTPTTPAPSSTTLSASPSTSALGSNNSSAQGIGAPLLTILLGVLLAVIGMP